MKNSDLHDRNNRHVDRWLLKLRDRHSVATILIGIGVDDRNGEATVCALENLNTPDLIVVLKEVLRLLETS